MRAVSEIWGALLLTVVVMAGLALYASHTSRWLSVQEAGMGLIAEQFRRRSGQLLSLIHSRVSGSTLELYLENYGWADARVQMFVAGGEDLTASVELYDAETGSQVDAIAVGRVTKLVATSDSDFPPSLTVTLITDAGAIYQWQV